MRSTASIGRGAVAAAALFVSGAAVGVGRQAGPAIRVVTTSEMRWAAVPGYPAGYSRAMLEGDIAGTGPHSYRVRLPAGFTIQPHTHDADEHVTVLEGTW